MLYQKQIQLAPQSVFQPSPSSVSSPATGSAETANWKTYTNKQYGFSFKYPEEWIKNDICDRFFFCLTICGVDTIPLQKDYKGTMSGRVTREAYIADKNYIDKGLIPKIGSGQNGKIIKINNRYMMQSLGYGGMVDSGYYSLHTDILSDKVEVTFSIVLPVKAIPRKDSYDEAGLDANLKKATELSQGIDNGKFENSEENKIVKQYQILLSTFKFTN